MTPQNRSDYACVDRPMGGGGLGPTDCIVTHFRPSHPVLGTITHYNPRAWDQQAAQPEEQGREGPFWLPHSYCFRGCLSYF